MHVYLDLDLHLHLHLHLLKSASASASASAFASASASASTRDQANLSTSHRCEALALPADNLREERVGWEGSRRHDGAIGNAPVCFVNSGFSRVAAADDAPGVPNCSGCGGGAIHTGAVERSEVDGDGGLGTSGGRDVETNPTLV